MRSCVPGANKTRMRGLLCLLLLLPAVSWSWVDLRNPSIIKYVHAQGGVTWKAAHDMCRRRHTELVTITGPRENLGFYRAGWIGLFRNRSDNIWRWSTGDEAPNVTYWNTTIGHPGDGDCAFKPYYEEERRSDDWHSDDCQAEHNFTCYEKNLFLVTEKKTWEEAVEHCKLKRYELATLLTPDDLAFARELAEGATTEEVWTGLRHLAGHWLWVDGQRVRDDQLPGCPAQGSCGALLIRGSQPIHTSSCELRKNFFCYKKHKVYTILRA